MSIKTLTTWFWLLKSSTSPIKLLLSSTGLTLSAWKIFRFVLYILGASTVKLPGQHLCIQNSVFLSHWFRYEIIYKEWTRFFLSWSARHKHESFGGTDWVLKEFSVASNRQHTVTGWLILASYSILFSNTFTHCKQIYTGLNCKLHTIRTLHKLNLILCQP